MTDHPSASREHFRALRRGLSEQQSLANARSLAQHVTRSDTFQACRHIACYLANDGEIDPAAIIEQAWSANKKVYLPVLAKTDNSLLFAPYARDCELSCNRFGIEEPLCDEDEYRTAQSLDLILMPLVAFDDAGNRLGMGGGFYDRTLAFRKTLPTGSPPVLMGLAHELQRVDALASESWDVPLDAIATENGLRLL